MRHQRQTAPRRVQNGRSPPPEAPPASWGPSERCTARVHTATRARATFRGFRGRPSPSGPCCRMHHLLCISGSFQRPKDTRFSGEELCAVFSFFFSLAPKVSDGSELSPLLRSCKTWVCSVCLTVSAPDGRTTQPGSHVGPSQLDLASPAFDAADPTPGNLCTRGTSRQSSLDCDIESERVCARNTARATWAVQ